MGDVERAGSEPGGAPAPGQHLDPEQQNARERDGQGAYEPCRPDALAEGEESPSR